MLRVVYPGRMFVLSLLLAAMAVVCPAQFTPFSTGTYAAKVISQTGQVSVVKDTQPWALSVGDSVQIRDLILTGPDGHALLQVSDGSTFEVFPNSRVVFRKNPPNWKDLLDVLVGRVRVHIEHFGNVPNPNRVLTPTAVISVRGTTFDITVTTMTKPRWSKWKMARSKSSTRCCRAEIPSFSIPVNRCAYIATSRSPHKVSTKATWRGSYCAPWRTLPSRWRRACPAREAAASVVFPPAAA